MAESASGADKDPYNPNQYLADQGDKKAEKPKADKDKEKQKEIKDLCGSGDSPPKGTVAQCKAAQIKDLKEKVLGKSDSPLGGTFEVQTKDTKENGKIETATSYVVGGSVDFNGFFN